jgi:diguanylate cyclase (GGDEF)-like protein/PAS domain S-box-containing protein
MIPNDSPTTAIVSRVPLWVIGGVVLLAVTLASIGNAYREYQLTIEQEYRLLEVRARQRVATISGALESVNLLLGSLIDGIDKPPGGPASQKNQLLSEALRLVPQLRSLIVTDASGRIVASNNEQLVGFDTSKREYFTKHRETPLDHRFHISRPFKTVTGVFATTMSRVMLDKHHQFTGVIVATFDSSYFNESLEFKVPSPGLHATLIHLDGDIISSVPSTNVVGQSIVGGIAYSEHMASQMDISRHLNVVKLSQVKRLTVFHNLPKGPLAIIVARDYDEAIGDWRKSLIIHMAGFFALTAITLLAFALTSRQKKALAQEIDRRTALEQSLVDSKLFVTSILDSLTEQVAVIDGDGVITAVNASWRQFATENNVTNFAQFDVGANYLGVCAAAKGLLNGDEAPDVQAGIKSVLAGTADEFTLEYPCHSPTEQRWFILHGLPLKGQHKGAVLIHQNVTERHQAEKALRTSEAHFRMLAENMADVVWKADREMRFTYINDADQRLRGFAREEVIGRPIADTLTAEGKVMLAKLIEERRQMEARGDKGRSVRFEIPQVRKDGSEMWFDILTMPTYDANNQINGFQGIGRDVTERRRQENLLKESQRDLEFRLQEISAQKIDLEEKATRDALTGVYNRRYLDETLPRDLSRAKREAYPVAVIMIDLDHFKQINDCFSHAAGDEVLKATAALLKKYARDSDIICRVGGEEFVVIMPGMSLEAARQRIDQLRQELADSRVHFNGDNITVTLSAGIASFPEHGDTVETLIARADEMLYRAKHAGRNQVMVYSVD